MSFTDIFIKRPVLAIVLSLILLLIGIRSFLSLPTRQFPEISASVVSITTNYPGASPEIIESFVSTPVENALAGISGIDYVGSESTIGNSAVYVHFNLGYDINKGVSDINSAVNSIRSSLPKEIDDPVVKEVDPNAEPTIYIPFLSNIFNSEQITDYLVRVIQPQISTLSGVSQAPIFGERLYSMRLWLNPQLMDAKNITAVDVINALSANNVQTAAGYIDTQWQEFNITAQTDLRTPEQFNKLVIKNDQGKLVRLQDVGYAKLGPQDDRVSVNINGQNSIVLAVIPQSTANPLDVSKEVNKVLPGLLKTLPKGLTGEIIWDSSKFIAQSIKEVYRTIIEATLFVVIVIFLFLGSLRNAVIPVTTIPLSLIGVCGFMLAMHYSVNVLTLLAWVLAIGLVVDDAIVVVENIHRHVEKGEDSFNAALIGTREIGFAVIAMTLTLAAVYTPIGFVSGLTGALFREFAFTLAGTVIISGYIALTLSPMMCSKLIKHNEKRGLPDKVDRIFQRVMAGYQSLLKKALARKKIMVIIAGLIYLSCYFLYKTLPSELAPGEDQGAIMSVAMGPSNSNLDYTISQTQKIEEIFKQIPEQIGYGVINGFTGTTKPNGAFAFLVLKPWDERKRTAQDIINSLFPQYFGIAGVRAFPFNIESLPGSSGNTPVMFTLKTTESYQTLYNAAQAFMKAASKNPALLNIDSDLKMDSAQINLDINRDKATDLGVSMNDINTALNLAFAQPTTTHFNMEGRSYEIIPELQPQFVQTAQQIGNLKVRTATGELTPLSNMVTINTIVAPESLNHFQQQRATQITASLAPGYTLGEALTYLQGIAQQTLPKTVQYDYAGQSRQLVKASGEMEETFIFAIIFIFLVLAAQFESFRDPLIVMLSVPLSTAGALATLHLVPMGTLNIYTQIGLVTLIGLISKHGILIVEFANQLQEQGRTKLEAIIESASIRLRPVVMTTCAMILGALPLALSSGAGSGARTQLGWVIVGGMSFGTLFTLFVIPTAYLFLASVKKHATTD